MNKSQKLVFGFGINDADYVTLVMEELPRVNGKRKRRKVWICKFFSVWKSMLKRVFDKQYREDFPSYYKVGICEDWRYFSKFKSWMETQDWEGKELDKDLLSGDSKIYSPDTCCFIPKTVNMFMTESTASRGNWPIGVCYVESTGKFRAQCRNPFTNKQETVGNFSTPEDAYKAWKMRKLEMAKKLAETISDIKVSTALINKYENY